MTPALVTITLALIAVAPFAGLPGLACVSPGAAWFGFGVVLLILAAISGSDKPCTVEDPVTPDDGGC